MEIFCEQKVITVISVAGCSVAGQAKRRSLHIILRCRAPVIRGSLPVFEPLNITRVVLKVSFPFLQRENKAFNRGQNIEKFSVALFENTDKVAR